MKTKNSKMQVRVGKIWYNLITFTDDCPYGKYGYKTIDTNKVFNTYVFFTNEDIEKIETYLNQ